MTTFTTDDRLNAESNTKEQVGKHTPGPWSVSANVSRHVIGPKGGVVASAELTWTNEISEANAKHIVACVNACEGLPDGCLDGGWTALGASRYAKKLETINAELLEALERLLQSYKRLKPYASPFLSDNERLAELAIAKARGEKV